MRGEGTHAIPSYPNPLHSNVNMHPMPGDRRPAEAQVEAPEPEPMEEPIQEAPEEDEETEPEEKASVVVMPTSGRRRGPTRG